jgi:carbon monoxide dehydrogenase subunit G
MALAEKLKQLGLTDSEVAELLGKAPRNALELSGNDLRAVRDDGTPVVVLSAPSLQGEFNVPANLAAIGADGTTVTFYVDATTGALMAGMGAVILNATGIVLADGTVLNCKFQVSQAGMLFIRQPP